MEYGYRSRQSENYRAAGQSAMRSGDSGRSRSSGTRSGSYSAGSSGRSPRRRRRRRRFNPVPLIVVLVILALIAAGVIFLVKKNKKEDPEPIETEIASVEEVETEPVETEPPETTAPESDLILDEAKRLALQYDYDGAIELLKNSGIDTSDGTEAAEMIAEYESARGNLIKQEPSQITHVFFHSLVVDTARAFDGDSKSTGYNQVMTTVDEFNKICQQMYDRGFVLVRLHDIAEEVDDTENGGKKMVYKDIMLPEGKKAFVMSQDDLCYYEYQKGDGLAERMIVGEDGRPTCEYVDADGKTLVGDYDLVPLLDKFIDEHPDFSYKGAKAAIAFTGYNGILGYRTDESYDPNSEYYDPKLADAPNENIETDRKAAVQVLKAMVDDGYELASHSWGHLDMGQCSFDRFTRDTDRWDRNVNSLIKEATGKPCDIIIFPKGADIGSWRGYSEEDCNSDGNHPDGHKRFQYYYDKGFRYFCNVDSSQYFVQKGRNYLRMGRRNLDGDRMWRDLSNPDKAKLSDLIDVQSVFDKARPTPVPGY